MLVISRSRATASSENRRRSISRLRLCREAIRHRRNAARLRAALRHKARSSARAAHRDRRRRDGFRQAPRRPRRRSDQADAQGIRPPGHPVPQRWPSRHPSPDSVRGLGAGAYDTLYLRVFIGQLRAKIERDPRAPKIVTTEPGVGYPLPRLEAPGVHRRTFLIISSAPRLKKRRRPAGTGVKSPWHARAKLPSALAGPGCHGRLQGALDEVTDVSGKKNCSRGAGALALGALALGATAAWAENTIKVGILHSLSGTMAISETTLKDVMLISTSRTRKAACSARGSRRSSSTRIELAAVRRKGEGAHREGQGRGCIGCWTSVSRKSVLPVFKELDSMLFYPVQYEGEESERNVFYTGAAPISRPFRRSTIS